eukprot:7380086-Prymnesium_polylepis.1
MRTPARLPTCPPARLPACPPARLRTGLPAGLPTHLPTHLPTGLTVAGAYGREAEEGGLVGYRRNLLRLLRPALLHTGRRARGKGLRWVR